MPFVIDLTSVTKGSFALDYSRLWGTIVLGTENNEKLLGERGGGRNFISSCPDYLVLSLFGNEVPAMCL